MQAEHSGEMLCILLPVTHCVGTTCFGLTRSPRSASMATFLKAYQLDDSGRCHFVQPLATCTPAAAGKKKRRRVRRRFAAEMQADSDIINGELTADWPDHKAQAAANQRGRAPAAEQLDGRLQHDSDAEEEETAGQPAPASGSLTKAQKRAAKRASKRAQAAQEAKTERRQRRLKPKPSWQQLLQKWAGWGVSLYM